MIPAAFGAQLRSGAFLGSRCAATYLRWALALGFVYAVVNPPFAVNDERSHLPRLHELSAGLIVTRTDATGQYHLVPESYRSTIRRYARAQQYNARIKLRDLYRDLKGEREQKEVIRLEGGAANYTPIAYLPQLPVMVLTRTLGLPTLWRLYLARLASVVGCALLTAAAIAVAGRLRWVFFALGLMPMMVTQAAGVSGDGMTNALAMLFFALLAKGTLEAPLARREPWLLVLVGGLLSLCKPPYLLFAFAPICLRMEGSRPWLRRLAIASIALLLNGGLLALWALLQRSSEVDQGPDYYIQVQAVRDNPLWAARLGLSSLFANLDDLVVQLVTVRDRISREMEFTGGVVGALYLQLLCTLSLGLYGRATRAERLRVRVPLLAIVLACTSSIYLAMLLTFTSPGAETIRGVQGRYFLPMLPPLLIVLTTFGRATLGRWLALRGSRRLLVPIVALNAVCALSLMARYYLSIHVDWPF